MKTKNVTKEETSPHAIELPVMKQAHLLTLFPMDKCVTLVKWNTRFHLGGNSFL